MENATTDNLSEESLPELLKSQMYALGGSDSVDAMVIDSLFHFFAFFAILLAAFLFFRFLPKFFPSENKSILRQNHALLWAIALLASLPFLAKGVHLGFDTAFHLLRIDAIFEGLKSGEFPVRISGIFNLNHGLPVNIFYGDWLLYFPAVLRFLGFSLSTAYQIYGVAIQFLSVYLAWFCFSRIFRNHNVALLSTAALMTTHYRFFTFYARGGVGEFTAMAFLPLILLGIWRIYALRQHEQNVQYFAFKTAIILALGMCGVLTSHVISAVIVILTLLGVALFFYKKTFSWVTFKIFALGAVLTLLLTAAFWVPFLDYYHNTFTEFKATATLYQSFIQTFSVSWNKLFVPFGWQHWMFADFTTLIALFVAFFLMLCGRANKQIQFFALFSVCLMWLVTNTFPWDFVTSLPFMNYLAQIQFPWRFLSISCVSLALLTGLLLKECAEKYRVFAYVMTAFVVFLNAALQLGDYAEYTGFPTALEKNHETIVQNGWELPNFTGLNVANENRNSDAQYQPFETNLQKLSRGFQLHNAELQFVQEEGIRFLFSARAKQGDSSITVPRLFYPYYRAASEAGELDLEVGENNLIQIILPSGFAGKVLLYFSPPWFWRMSEVVSFLSFVVLLVAIVKIRQKSTVNG